MESQLEVKTAAAAAQAAAEIVPAAALTEAWVRSLEHLLEGSSNRFVCLQAITMAREAASGKPTAAHHYFAKLTVAGITVAVAVVRIPSDSQDQAFIDLLVTSVPGRGHGALLLAAVEAHCAAVLGAAQLHIIPTLSASAFWRRRGYRPASTAPQLHAWCKRLP